MAQISMLVDRNQVEQILYDAGFRRIDVDYVDKNLRYSSPEELINLMEASSFGNFLRDVPEELRARAREDMKKAMESMRTGKYIELPSKTMFAVAYKPRL